MKRPAMILFDLGRTLLYEPDFDPARGDAALCQFITKNPNGCTLQDVRREMEAVFRELDEVTKVLHYDIPCATGCRLALEHLGIELSLTPLEREIVFHNAASPGAVVPWAGEMLDYLNEAGVRTGVVSNNGWSGEALRERVDRLLPQNRFEFILSSCDYLLRKPDKRLFEIALQKARLPAAAVWYCGDSVPADVCGAHNAGLFPVLFEGEIPIGNSFDRRSEAPPVDFEYLHIHDWRELMEALQSLS
ncbi:MAG: HAD family hydrolase [Oscillospiraceae bacterium]